LRQKADILLDSYVRSSGVIGEAGGINLYGFVGNNPVNRIDPYGLDYHFYGNPKDFPPGMSPLVYGDTTSEQVFAAFGDIGGSILNGVCVLSQSISQSINWLATKAFGNDGPGFVQAGIPELVLLTDLGKVGECSKTTALVDQYALKAAEDAFYPVMKWGFDEPQAGVWLNAGDVWKYGKTMNPATRYSQAFLKEWGLRYDPRFTGTDQEALDAEYDSLIKYLNTFGRLPPGNKMLR
jgi:uncharacterized protein RhaS with RHS repeats